MKKFLKLLIITNVFILNSAFAQNIKLFPIDIPNYQKKEKITNEVNTTLQLVLFDKTKFNQLLLNNEDLIRDAQDLNNKINDFFKNYTTDKLIYEKNTKGKITTKNNKKEDVSKGYLLITEYFFVGKDKPIKLEDKEINEDLQKQIYEESQCQEGICISHIIMGINYFDDKLNIQALDIKNFGTSITSKDQRIIHANYEKSQEGILKIYYFYGVNGLELPKNKETIKKIIKESEKN